MPRAISQGGPLSVVTADKGYDSEDKVYCNPKQHKSVIATNLIILNTRIFFTNTCIYSNQLQADDYVITSHQQQQQQHEIQNE
jgi:hypothetical protein